MVELYVKKIKDDNIDFTLEDVPKLWKQKVIKRLIEDGYIVNDYGTVVKDNSAV